MPMIWTHIQFCEDVVDSIQKTQYFSQYEPYMKFGAQGTNLFFHHNLWSKKQGDHNSHIYNEHLLFKMIKYATNKPKHVHAFVFGFATHFILERKIRPYLNHLTTKIDCNHIKVESQIDTLIMKKIYNLETWKTPVYNEINIGSFIDKHIVKMLTEVNHPVSHHIKKTYWFVKFALRFYFDPYGWKIKVLPSFQPTYSPYYSKQSGIDFLNEANHIWLNKNTNETSVKSFIQLYDEAKMEAIITLKDVVRYWNNPNEQMYNHIVDQLTLSNHESTLTRSS